MRTHEATVNALKSLWRFPDEVIDKVATAMGDSLDEADDFLDFMDGQEVSNPAEIWADWCYHNDIVHEIDNNPFLA